LFPDATSYVSIPFLEHQSQADAVRFMDYLVLPYSREAFQNVPKMDRVNGNLSPRSTLKVENIVIPAIDGKNTSEWLATRARLGSQYHHVGYFVADDGLGEAEETGEQNLVSQSPIGHRAVVFIYYLNNAQIFEDVHPLARVALHSAESLLSAIDVKDRTLPRSLELLPQFAGQRFAATSDNTGIDMQAPLELFCHKQPKHRWKTSKDMGLKGI